MTDTGTAVDSLGILEATLGLPEQVAAAMSAADGLDELPDKGGIENVVILGMGGSGVAGDVLVHAAGPFLPVPAVVVKSYVLPAFVSDASLVFAISMSGDTEETIEAASEAALQGAKMVVVSGGGHLSRL